MKPPSKRSYISLLACLAGVLARAQDVPAEPVWVARASADTYSATSLLELHPGLKRVYLPLVPFETLGGGGTDLQGRRAGRQLAECRKLRQHGVTVCGVFAPLMLEDAVGPRVSPDVLERSLANAFGPALPPFYLSIHHPEVGPYVVSQLHRWLASGEIDEAVLSLNMPATVLFAYGTATREHFVEEHRFDPVDLDFPLGLPEGFAIKDRPLVDLIVKDRLESMATFASFLIEACRREGKPVSLLAPMFGYAYPSTTRAAAGVNWARHLLESPGLRVILNRATDEPLTADRLSQTLQFTKRLGIGPDRLLILERDHEGDARLIRALATADPSLAGVQAIRFEDLSPTGNPKP